MSVRAPFDSDRIDIDPAPVGAPGACRGGAPKSEHLVQFYDSENFLIRSLAAFIGAGLNQGEIGLVIATTPHLEALERLLREDGHDVAHAQRLGTYLSLDASVTLSKFMIDDAPDRRLFNHVMGSLASRLTSRGRPLRAFGEMVTLLWEAGHSDAALKLEQFWNELGQKHCFTVVCAYPMAGFADDETAKPFAQVCKAHTHVIPAESYTASASTDDRLRVVTQLQQRAASLEAEIARRKKIEKELLEQKRELSDLLENSTEGIHQIAADGTILWANRAELKLLGYSAAEYIGQDVRKFHADAEVINNILSILSRGESLRDYEARLKHKDGSLRYVSINANAYWDGPKFRYTRFFTRAVTERKTAKAG